LVFQALKTYSTEALLPMLEDGDVIVRSAVARELHARGERNAFDAALRLCGDSRDFVREIAAFTLGQLGTPTYPFRSESIPRLATMAVGDRSFEVRASAVAGLGHLHAAERLDTLLQASHDAESEVRAMAAVSLGRLGPLPDVVTALDRLLSDPDGEVRDWATLGVELTQSYAD
jgi:HEAT repeat protein